MSGFSGVKLCILVVYSPLEEGLEHILHDLLPALADSRQGDSAPRRLGEPLHHLHSIVLPEPLDQGPRNPLRRARSKHLPERCGHVGNLLRSHAKSGGAQAVFNLPVQLRPGLAGLLRRAARCPYSHRSKGRTTGKGRSKHIQTHLSARDAHIHRQPPRSPQPILGLRGQPHGILSGPVCEAV